MLSLIKANFKGHHGRPDHAAGLLGDQVQKDICNYKAPYHQGHLMESNAIWEGDVDSIDELHAISSR